MTTDVPSAAWESLAPWWRLAFEEAWAWWTDGNFGIGAVLVDPATADVVAVGRNRVAQGDPAPRTLTGNMTAHAEMNAFAALDRFDAEGLHLVTTLEPCLMCAATAMQLKVAHVHFAEHDEFYDGMHTIWDGFEVTAARRPATTGPFSGERSPLAAFARLLPLEFTLRHFPGRTAERLARATHPRLARLADDLATDDQLPALRDASCLDALTLLWPRLSA